MRWTRPQHPRWLAACLLGLLISVWAGGISVSMVAVFAIVFGAGAALLVLDTPRVPDTEPPEPFEDDQADAMADTAEAADAD